MKLIEKVEIFVTGTIVDSNGHTNKYTLSDLQEMADSYDLSVHEAPVVIGHENDKAWHKSLSSKSQLANGWVKTLYVEENSLYCDMEVDDFTYNAIKSDKLKKRSIGHYVREAKNNPANGKLYLRHLALLGAEPPAVKSLKDIVLYKENDMKENSKMLNEKSADWLAYSLMDEGNGFNGNILAFDPSPSEVNNWLYNKEDEQFAGKFADDKGQVFDFTIAKEGDNWVSNVSMSQESQEADAPAEAEEVADEEILGNEEPTEEEISGVEEEETVEATETVEETVETPVEAAEEEDQETVLLKEQLKLMQDKLSEYEAKEKEAKFAESKKFCDMLYDRDALTEKDIKRDSLYQIINALENMADALYYSEGDNNKLSVADGVKQLLSNLPSRKQYSDAVYSRAGNTEITVPHRNGTKESNAEYKKIKQFMDANNITNFAVGYREYRKNK